MKKISIYGAVRTKIIIRYVCAFVVVLMLGAALTTNLLNTSHEVSAIVDPTPPYCDGATPVQHCTIRATGGGITTYSIMLDTRFDNSDLTITRVPSGWTSRFVVFISGVHTFNSLTIENGATLTHDPLYAGTDFSTATDVLTTTGRNKKVDLIINTQLILRSGGRIDVNGKGYPGQYMPPAAGCTGGTCGNGYGPGGGFGFSTHDDHYQFAGSAGYGGQGGQGVSGVIAPFGPTYGVDDPYTVNPNWLNLDVPSDFVQHGSGGGAFQRRDGGSDWPGGNGGGIVRIRTLDISIDNTSGISANGDGSQTEIYSGGVCSPNYCGGSGSGGAILVQITGSVNNGALEPDVSFGAELDRERRYSSAAGSFISVRDGTRGTILTRGPVNTLSPDDLFFNIQAAGGSSINTSGDIPELSSTGGGGRIFIIASASPTVRKSLEAVNRPYNASPVNANFNPYALQLNDKINVKITLSPLAVGNPVAVSENLLKSGNVSAKDYYCDPVLEGAGAHVNQVKLTFTNPATGFGPLYATDPGTTTMAIPSFIPTQGDMSMYYTCIVSKVP